MLISEMNWMQVEEYLKKDDRAVLPLGSTEQHAYLSLSVDSILSSKMAQDAAKPVGVPVFPVVAYGLTSYFAAYPGTITLRPDTYNRLIWDILDSLHEQGFRRILLLNGHGGNRPIEGQLGEWMRSHSDSKVKIHHWWAGAATMAKQDEFDKVGSHASWTENFPWTRLEGVEMPASSKPMFNPAQPLNPQELRELLGDGNYGGLYQRPDSDMLAIWEAAVLETRDLLENNW